MTKGVKAPGTFENMIMEGVTMPLIRDEINRKAPHLLKLFVYTHY